ncbi:pyrroloquinoline quinone biosynthesis protein PqqE [Enterococcus casseliflavus]|uniref:radical SAM protein n=1 Tax=Enterococcus casseliflavus TaxID=37734 RepID=UPI000E00B37A|nr:radical SAM protein [Enterococcus casseliflavus]GEB30396.1 hypothetical protein ECA02_34910 [Enterococcus casseliflavus]STP33020.1 pyrroloquinoline quinone biosynthesis protein PqqE [Enterococcus casseliflavus]
MEDRILPYPTSAAILTTYKCTAACKECCFECSPNIDSKNISYSEMVQFIDEVSEIPSIGLVVWSGGECFLLKNTLLKGVMYAKSKGLVSRIVTNGFWCTSIKKAEKTLLDFKNSGLAEINFSTGDSHQKFVPVERILNGAIAALKIGLTVCISVETTKNNTFLKDDLLNHQLYLKYIKNTPYENHIFVSSTVWVSFHTDNQFEYEEESVQNKVGCDSIFDTVGLEPHNGLVGCCGLTVGHIKELQLGSLSKGNVWERYAEQYDDFLKIWIYTDGPDYILRKVKEWAPEIAIPKFYHRCLSCAFIYNSPDILSVINQNYDTIVNEVLTAFEAKVILTQQRVKPSMIES